MEEIVTEPTIKPEGQPAKEPLEVRLARAEKELRERARRRRVQRAQDLAGIRDHRLGPC